MMILDFEDLPFANINQKYKQESIPIGCVMSAWKSYMLQWPVAPPDVTRGPRKACV